MEPLTNHPRPLKLLAMKYKLAYPMVTTTMAMRSMMQMEMFCRTDWKAR